MPEQTTVTSSEQFSWNWKDLANGALMAAGGAVVGLLIGMLSAEQVVFDWTKIWQTGVAAALVYLAKNFFDKPKIVIVNPTKADVKAVKEGSGEAEVKVVPK